MSWDQFETLASAAGTTNILVRNKYTYAQTGRVLQWFQAHEPVNDWDKVWGLLSICVVNQCDGPLQH